MRAMHGWPDEGSAHRRGRRPRESYLGIEKISAAATDTRRAGDPSGLHGFLSEERRVLATRAWPSGHLCFHRPAVRGDPCNVQQDPAKQLIEKANVPLVARLSATTMIRPC